MKRPKPLTKEEWPPDYKSVFLWRQQQLAAIRSSPLLLKGAREYYRTRPVEFVCDWFTTYDPRHAGRENKLSVMPFVMFNRQADMLNFLEWCRKNEQGGLVEKARDMGATWLCCAYSVWLWLFVPSASIGWGSRKENLVDKIGDADSIFEKMRILIRWLPHEFLPRDFNENRHATYMRIINPENDAKITGEAGDNIGRGGRNGVYFLDEAAFVERPEKIAAALSANTRVQIDISSVNGLGNVFHRKREAGVEWSPDADVPRSTTAVFVMDWRDHPEKTQEWFDAEKQRYENEGLLHLFASEVERNYAAAVDNVVIRAEWIDAAVDAHVKLGIDASAGAWVAGLDVADGGGDRNAFVARQGIVLKAIEEWGAPDAGHTSRRAVDRARGLSDKVNVQYDPIGVGSAVKSEINRLKADNTLPAGITFQPWNAGAKVVRPHARIIEGDKQSPKNMDFYHNLKAQGWWELRARFYKTFRAVKEGAEFNPEELISIDSNTPNLHQLKKELSQVTYGHSTNMKLLINKTPEGTRSPNIADACVMSYHPVTDGIAKPVFGVSSGE